MKFFNTLSVFSLVFASLFFTIGTNATTFAITNTCPYTVWAAAKPGGGKQLDSGATWQISVPDGTTEGRIWARTNCQFDASGKGKCETGDCNGMLECQGYGAPPNTLAEYSLKQYANLDYIDISVIDGFNVPMEFSSASGSCSRVIKCVGDIIGQCPIELKVPDGCQGACPKFNQEQYCCNSGPCNATNYSKFFKDRCPDAYSYPKDDPTSLFTCPSGTNYKVVFCPLVTNTWTVVCTNNRVCSIFKLNKVCASNI